MKSFILILSFVTFAVEAQDWKPVQDQREQLEQILVKTPYKDPEHTAIKAYFSKLGSFKTELEGSQKLRKRLSSSARTQGVEAICGDLILPKALWVQLIKNCTRNGFFLCSEEAREFPALKQGILSQLELDVLEQSRTALACK